MEYPVAIPGVTRQRVSVALGGFNSPTRVLVNGTPAPKLRGQNTYLVDRDDGNKFAVKVKDGFFDTGAKLEVGGQTIPVGPRTPWYAIAWIMLPLGLVIIGGAIGGVVGALAATLNRVVFRTDAPGWAKYALTAFIGLGAFVLWVVAVVVIQVVIFGY